MLKKNYTYLKILFKCSNDVFLLSYFSPLSVSHDKVTDKVTVSWSTSMKSMKLINVFSPTMA